MINLAYIVLIACIIDLILLFLIFLKLLKIKKKNKKIKKMWLEEVEKDPDLTLQYKKGFKAALVMDNQFYD